MKRLFVYLFLAASISLILMGCSNKNSLEACQHQVTMNLDSGNYDGVLASGCAGEMQRGAAYMGKAGFDIKDVVNRFIDQGVSNGQATGDLASYMDSLVGQVTSTSLAYLDQSNEQYELVCDNTPTTEPAWKDANFNESVVNSLKSLSLIKTVIDSGGTGSVASCDLNRNGVRDEADATTCALIASSNTMSGANTACNGASYAPLAPADMTLYYDQAGQNPVEGTYSGLVITVSGAPVAGCSSTYKRLLYKSAMDEHWVATTTADTCYNAAGQGWPCPLAGANVDLVATIDLSLSSAVISLDNATSGSQGSDVITAIKDIKANACSNGPCTNESIAKYLQTLKK